MDERADARPRARVAVHLVAAAAQAGFVAGIFMQLKESSPLVRIFAYGNLLWLLILFGFMPLDYLHRRGGDARSPAGDSPASFRLGRAGTGRGSRASGRCVLLIAP